jgi:hypothetical protein
LRQAWRQHQQDLRDLFFEPLTEDDLHHLADIWSRLDQGRAED